MDESTPVLVGASALTQRLDDPLDGVDAITLMEQASRAALDDAGASGLLELVGEISVPVGTWSHPNAAGVIAQRLGSTAKTLRSELGVLQSSLIHRALGRLASGELDAALIVGGEAKFRELQAAIAGVELADHVEEVADPDTVQPPKVMVIDRVEIDAGLVQAVQHYAFIEHALRAADGQSVSDHRRQVAELVADFNRVARTNPKAWNREPMDAAFIEAYSAKNKPLAAPYAKWHNSQWNVDQAAALVLTTVAHASRLGIDESRWVYPWAGADSDHVAPVTARAHLDQCPGFTVTAATVHELSGVQRADHHELYSCFPSAVRMQARALGLDERVAPSVTGGMAFGGGPFNNFVLQATAQMAEVLRSDPGSFGLVSAISGMLTKQGMTMWSTAPHATGWQHANTTDAVAAATEVRPVVAEPPAGDATIVSYTVLFEGLEPSRGVAIVDTSVGRSIVETRDTETLAAMLDEEFCGREIVIGELFS